MAFLVGVGALQFIYVVLVGNFVRFALNIQDTHPLTMRKSLKGVSEFGSWVQQC